VSFVAIILCVASQRVFTVAAYFVIDSVRKLLDTPSLSTRALTQRSGDWCIPGSILIIRLRGVTVFLSLSNKILR
jgi:hypothetical protein